MESELSLPRPQGHAAGFYPEPDTSPFHSIKFSVPNFYAIIISPSSCKLSFRFPTKISYQIHISSKTLPSLPPVIFSFTLSA
jgi:hypothetical protein